MSQVEAIDRFRRQLVVATGRYVKILQVDGQIAIPKGESFDSVMQHIRRLVHGWLRRKKVPLSLEDVESTSWDYEDEHSARTLSIESGPEIWAMRFDDPCGQLPGRIWRVELALGNAGSDSAIALGCALSVLIPMGVTENINPSVPSIIRKISQKFGLYVDGRKLDGNPWHIDTSKALDEFLNLAESPNRTRAIIAFSESDLADPIIDFDSVASKLSGIAHVVVIDKIFTSEIFQRYGRLSVYGGSARVYRTELDLDSDNSFKHPLFTYDRWSGRAAAMLRALQFDSIQETLTNKLSDRGIPSFSIIRRVAANQRLKAVLNTPQTVESNAEFLRNLELIKSDAEGWQELAHEEEIRRKDAEIALEEARTRLWYYKARIDALEEEIASHGIETDLVENFPNDFEGLQDWSEKTLAARVVVTHKALKAAKKSVFQDHASVYKALLHLATSYWTMRVKGGTENLKACQEREAELGLYRSQVGTAISSSRYEAQYKVTHEGRVYVLDQHLSGNDTRNPERCLRIYFCWDEDEQLVIVGHLPSHLDNSLT